MVSCLAYDVASSHSSDAIGGIDFGSPSTVGAARGSLRVATGRGPYYPGRTGSARREAQPQHLDGLLEHLLECREARVGTRRDEESLAVVRTDGSHCRCLITGQDRI